MADEWRPVILSSQEAMRLLAQKKRPDGVGEGDSVMISDDMRLKDGLLADRDRAIFEEMRRGEGIPLSDPGITGPVEVNEEENEPAENIRRLAGLRGQQKQKMEQRILNERLDARYERLKVWIDDGAAAYIRYLRVEQRGTWRYVAGMTAERYGMDWGEDQIYGMMLCRIAAERHDERHMEGVWN